MEQRANKVKIVLDADVIIHFIKGGLLPKLPDVDFETFVCNKII